MLFYNGKLSMNGFVYVNWVKQVNMDPIVYTMLAELWPGYKNFRNHLLNDVSRASLISIRELI